MPPHASKRQRPVQRIVDVADSAQLVRFATATQLARLEREGTSQNTIARAAGIGESSLSKVLAGDTLTDNMLEKLDFAIGAHAIRRLERIGGLGKLNARMQGLRNRTRLSTKISIDNLLTELERDPRDDPEVLRQASAMVDLFLARESGAPPNTDPVHTHSDLRANFQEKIKLLVDHLILIGMAPPTPDNVEALILLGSLLKFSLGLTRPDIDRALRNDPLGFRIWRAVTKAVLLSTDAAVISETRQQALRVWVRELLKRAPQMREASIYPGRSLDLELALAIPHEWSRGNDGDLVMNMLYNRAIRPNATLRERGTASHGMWQRAITDPSITPAELSAVEGKLRELIVTLQDETTRPDAAAGTRWIATTLQYLLDTKTEICNDFPDPGEPWFDAVQQAADSLDDRDVPAHILPGMKTLFRHMLLQNAGILRRRSIDTLRAAGMTEPVVGAIEQFLDAEKHQSWLRVRALFALGFLQQRDSTVGTIFATAFEHAITIIKDDNAGTAQFNELHAVLFAIGDCFGAQRESAETQRLRLTLEPHLRVLALEPSDNPRQYLYTRALAYLLAVTAQDRQKPGVPDLSQELLEHLRGHQDPITRNLSAWILGFRFHPATGAVQPLFASAHRPVSS
ncbi:hypothetical protein GCM10027589_00930 [Actinocorallia lasiicapitis]